ncbi:MAG: phage gp6-like head-tail connector protein [Oscillospiraceae bacterium]|nr:phage gp6-like head-tail connector protein [Oscillospiraceae bacterium]
MLETVRTALRITTNLYDSELESLIDAALGDLGIAGVNSTLTNDPLVVRAVITYVRCHFGNPPDYDRLKAAYDEQKAQLQTATGYTDWGDGDAEV